MNASNLIGYDGCFATRLRELMKKAKVTQQDLAAAVGTTRQAISQYADGSVQPNIEKLYKISEFFHVSADYLLGLSDNPNPDINNREISRITGLTEHSIERLVHETKWICEFGKSNNPQEALKYWLSKYNDESGLPYPKFHTINLLLADSPINLNYDPIIDTLGQILAFKRISTNENEFYGLFKHISTADNANNLQIMSDEEFDNLTDKELDELIDANNGYFDMENEPNYFVNRNDILDLLLVKLQGTIKRYKDENDKDSNV